MSDELTVGFPKLMWMDTASQPQWRWLQNHWTKTVWAKRTKRTLMVYIYINHIIHLWYSYSWNRNLETNNYLTEWRQNWQGFRDWLVQWFNRYNCFPFFQLKYVERPCLCENMGTVWHCDGGNGWVLEVKNPWFWMLKARGFGFWKPKTRGFGFWKPVVLGFGNRKPVVLRMENPWF